MKDVIYIENRFGKLCANGDNALAFLQDEVIPLIHEGKDIAFDFMGVRNMNSSFSNALFANLVMQEGVEVLGHVTFKNCNSNIKALVNAALDFGYSKLPMAEAC
ncbi:MAG: STAS-like domain-containing protein [Candidatus Electrothrix sp. Rat3]|nr:STAS-like domain-containing protein [Candidatus Electrothrix rattekaaiensis]